MRILLVHNFYQQTGGEDVVVTEEAALLERNGHEVSLFSVHNRDIVGIAARLKTLLLVAYNPFARRALAQRIREFHPDVVHVHNFFPLLSPSVFDACIDVGVPSVMTLHNFRLLCPTAFLYHGGALREDSLRGSCWWTVKPRVYKNSRLGTFAVASMVELHKYLGTWKRKVNRFIALSSFSRDIFIQAGLPAERLVIKPNTTALPPTEVPPQAARRGALFVGRLSEEKGIELLLRAWDDIDYPLRIAGTGPLSHLVKQTTNRNIVSLGRLDATSVRAEMERAAFLVVPSVCYEMFGMAPVEAFSCGLPVIASNLGSLSEMVDDHRTGLHFAAGSVMDLREKVRWAVAHVEELRLMGINARKTYDTRYSARVTLDTLTDIYTELLSARLRPGSSRS